METYIGDNEPAAVQIVRELIPDNTPYAVVGHGQDNLIIIADDHVYRFPRNETVWRRSGLEKLILEALSDHPELPTPILRHVHEQPAYTIATALDGRLLENTDIRALSLQEQRNIGKGIGTFAATFHTLLTPDDIVPLLAEKHPQARYAQYLTDILGQAKGPYADLAAWVLSEWPKHDHSETTVIHDDLHAHNLLFDDDGSLTGVLDFGDVNLGNPEQDLRYVYWMGDTVFDEATTAYEQCSGRTLDRELIQLCAVSQELSGLYDPKRSYMHKRAEKNLSFRNL